MPLEARPMRAGNDVLAVYYLILIDYADAEARKVVFAVRIKTRHFGSLAAYKRAARLPAALAHTRDDVRRNLGNELARSEIVEEKQRSCAVTHDVVRAHGDAVDTYRVVTVL